MALGHQILGKWGNTDLCRRLRPEVGRGERGEKVSAEELLHRVRAALKSGDWLNITAAVWTPRGPDMMSVVKQLSAAELVAFSKALVDRYEYPRERINCERWFSQILEHGSHAVIDSEAFREETCKLHPFLVCLLVQTSHGWYSLRRAWQVRCHWMAPITWLTCHWQGQRLT
eukprot:s1787_g4.t1